MPLQRSQAVAPGRFIPLARFTGVEVLPDHHPVAVQVAKTTIHGRAPQIFAVGVRMIRAAMRADPRLAAGLAAVLPELSVDHAEGPQDLIDEHPANLSPETTAGHLCNAPATLSTGSNVKAFAPAVTNQRAAGREEATVTSTPPLSPLATAGGLPLADPSAA